MKDLDTNQSLKLFFKYFIKYLFNPRSYYGKYDVFDNVYNSNSKQKISSNQKKVVQKMNNNIDYINKFKPSGNSYDNKFRKIVREQDYKREYIEDDIKAYKEEDMEEDVEEETGENMPENAEVQLAVSKKTEVNYDDNLNKQQILLDFNPQNIKMGFIYSEILGKPKCKRRGRG